MALAAGVLAVAPPVAEAAVSTTASVIINEVYGGGGNTGAPFNRDFIELYNTTAAPINLTGFSLQYKSATGATWTGKVDLTGAIPANGLYTLATTAAGGIGAVVVADQSATTINMSATDGNVALVNTTSTLACVATLCQSDSSVVDLVALGTGNAPAVAAAPAASNTTSIERDHLHTNRANNVKDFVSGAATPGTTPAAPAAPVVRTIAQIQGTATASTLVGTNVTTSGVVTAVYPTGGFYGYVIQTAGTGGDATLAARTASDGLFVYSPVTVGDILVGKAVTVTGIVSESATLTQITVRFAANLVITSPSATVPAPITATWPTTDANREKIESMLYQPVGTYTVSNNFATNSFGEVGLSFDTKPALQPTDVGPPGSAAANLTTTRNAERKVTLDDGASIAFLTANTISPPYLTSAGAPRVGSTAIFNKPVIIDWRNSLWKFQPQTRVVVTTPPANRTNFTDGRAGNATPDFAGLGSGEVRVASFNVLNYFTTLGTDSITCTSFNDRLGEPVTVNSGCEQRGAWDALDLANQQGKIVQAINGLDADVVGLMEIENSAKLLEPADEALGTLVAALNAAAGMGTWAFVPSSAELPPVGEMDVISNAIIYKPGAVSLIGAPRALGTLSAEGADPLAVTDDEPFANAREPLGQAFAPIGGGEPFFVAVNHFKSKGSGLGTIDADFLDGQSPSNYSRVRQAEALRDWIPTVLDDYSMPAVKDVFLVGDFNSYTWEDPLLRLYGVGYVNVNAAEGNTEQSYSFSGLNGSLDHVLANPTAYARVTGSDIWTINGPESIVQEYSRLNYHPSVYFNPNNPFRSSDHDPVIVGVTAAAVTPDTFDLNLLGINDFHGRIEANSGAQNVTLNFAGTVEQTRLTGGSLNSLFLSAGDNISASLFASAVQDDEPTLALLNALDLDASAVGNHEFDQGVNDLINDVEPLADFDYLGANVYNSDGEPVLDEYAIFTLPGADLVSPSGDDFTVGVIGVVTAETPSLVAPSGVATLNFGSPVDAINRVAEQLSDGNPFNGEADLLVATLHEGAGFGVADGATLEEEVMDSAVFAKIVNETSAEVEAIFTGHTHKEYAWEGPVPGEPEETRPIVQTGNYGERVGQVVLTIDADTHEVVAHQQRNVLRSTTISPALTAVYPRVAAAKVVVDAALAYAAIIGGVPKGSLDGTLQKSITTAYSGGNYTTTPGVYSGGTRDDRAKESTLGGLVADALRATLAAPLLGGADIGVVNPGGMRAELFYAKSGAEAVDGIITFAEANGVLPFANNLNTITLTGAQVKTMLEQQWQRNADNTVPSRPYLQLGLSSNVRYTFDSTLPEGSRITSITVNGIPIDPAAPYRIGTFSFLTDGGDNFHVFKQGTAKQDSGIVDRDGWIQYLVDHPGLAPDYARQAVEITGKPSAATTGAALTFGVKGLDLTSLGSPLNTSLTITIGGVSHGAAPITAGNASVNVTVDDTTPIGTQTVQLVASPSGTTVTFPITVAAGLPPATVPDAPSAVAGVAGDAQVAVSWLAPADDGGSTITGYTVTATPGSATCTTTGALTCTVTGLTNGTEYTFTVVATNDEGNSVPSAASAGVTPVAPIVDTAPGAATTVTGVAGDAQVAVSWLAPADDGGSTITGYTVTATPGSATCTTAGALTCTVTGLANGTGYTFTVVAANAIGSGPASAPSNTVTPTAPVVPPIPDTFAAVSPKRLFDTRAGLSPDALRTVAKVKVGGTTIVQVKVIDLPGGLVPATGVAAVALNVTATGAGVAGFVTVYPCGVRPGVSSVNYALGQTVANAVIAPVSASGEVCFYSSQDVDLIADVNGWFHTGGDFSTAGPARVFDTRPGLSPDAIRTVAKAKVGGTTILSVKVTDLAGLVPATGVDAVLLNVTATGAGGDGFVTVYPCGVRKEVSSVNYAIGGTSANAVIAPVSASGEVCFYSSQNVDLIADVNGWFAAGADFDAVGPDRIFDTRPGLSPGAIRTVAKAKVGGATILSVKVTDLPGLVPASGVGAVLLNVTATGAGADGFVTVYPCGTLDLVSSLNYAAGGTSANAVLAPVSATGNVCFYSSQDVDLIADINGWFAA